MNSRARQFAPRLKTLKRLLRLEVHFLHKVFRLRRVLEHQRGRPVQFRQMRHRRGFEVLNAYPRTIEQC